jgi:hypothetical protein
MRPIIIVPPGALSKEDIKLLRDNELCVVVAKDPSQIKFLDPIPCISSRSQIENAAIKLSRKILNGTALDNQTWNPDCRAIFARMFVELLIQGTPLDRNGTIAEQEENYFNESKLDELDQLARQEARAEYKARKVAKEKAAAKKKTDAEAKKSTPK